VLSSYILIVIFFIALDKIKNGPMSPLHAAKTKKIHESSYAKYGRK
jgi:hypothetical protein